MTRIGAVVAVWLAGAAACGGHADAPGTPAPRDAGADTTVGGSSGGSSSSGSSGAPGSSGSSSGGSSSSGGAGSGSSSSGSSSSGSSSGSGPVLDGGCAPGLCTDFPPQPIVDPNGVFSGLDPASLFGPAGSGSTQGGPCLVEPADGALYPKNWVRPRIAWSKTPDQVVFEVRIHSEEESSDLVVYTTQTEWTMDAATWQSIAYAPSPPNGAPPKDGHLVGSSLAVTVRASTGVGLPTVSSRATVQIAPALAGGNIIYFAATSLDESAAQTSLRGFRIGDEATVAVLASNEVQQQVRAQPADGGNLTGNFQQVGCVGCHTATPDGLYVGFTAQWPWPDSFASVQTGSAGAVPPWLSAGAVQNLSPNYRGDPFDSWYTPPAVDQISLGMGTFPEAHYQPGDRIYVSTLGASWTSSSPGSPGVASGVTSQLAWFNLEWQSPLVQVGELVASGLPAATPCMAAATYPGLVGSAQPCLPAPASNGGWGIIARNGDSRSAGSPAASHGTSGTDVIAYASTNAGVKDGRMDCSASSSCVSDIYVVPYSSKGLGLGAAGGAAVALGGAADPAFSEYDPAWSPDDALIAFNRVPAGASLFAQPLAEVYVVGYNRGAGSPAVAITPAFPPPSCSNPPSAGPQNSWPRWAPNPPDASGARRSQVDAAGNTYEWLAFSSTRNPRSIGMPQIYVVGVVVDAMGGIRTYAPVYPWNQEAGTANLMPDWSDVTPSPFSPPP